MMIIAGDIVKFDPFKEFTGFASGCNRGNWVTGTVVDVNYANTWFSVEYSCGGRKQRTSYKFSQIGEDVRICG